MGSGGLPSPLQHPGEGLGAGGGAGRGRSQRGLLRWERARPVSGGTCRWAEGGAMDASVLGPPRSRGLQTRPCVPAWRCAQNRLCVSPPSMVPASLDGLELICCLGATPSKAPREGSLRRGFVKAVFPQPLKMHEEAQSAGLGATAPIHLIKPRSSPCHPHPALPGVSRPKCSPLPAQ